MYRLVLLSLLAPVLSAAPLKFASGVQRTHVIELYSSEGCSSCPPAESWLGGLRTAPGLWRDFVPVAFHVVYWDYLGWTDRFASRDFTARQYAYSRTWHTESVYTPGFVLDGEEWRAGAGHALPPASTDQPGVLTVELSEDGKCLVHFAADGDHVVFASLLGGDIVSPVRAGENSGRTLRHEFVALGLAHAPLENGRAELTLATKKPAGVARLALAVWVARRGELTPRQATGGWIE